ncbi:hypothetical protein Hanom_Chr04g00288631 [Helianthus anomalus]
MLAMITLITYTRNPCICMVSLRSKANTNKKNVYIITSLSDYYPPHKHSNRPTMYAVSNLPD